ncbi:MAG: hypothetical protein MUF54_08230 [Polyangiaceae bacterium]|nr:hypothetical protein [Polyangiaceae bacterium]
MCKPMPPQPLDEDILMREGLPSTTHKVEIRSWQPPDGGSPVDVNFFVHLVWGQDGRLHGIDCDGLNGQAGVVKALARELCRELSQRIEHEEIDLNYICERWVAQRFEPAGICPQVPGIVSSVLDGAAKVLRSRYLSFDESTGSWKEKPR